LTGPEPANRSRWSRAACGGELEHSAVCVRRSRSLVPADNYCMEKGAYPWPSGGVLAYSAISEDSQQADIDGRRTLDLYHATSSSPDLSSKIKPSLPDLRAADVSLSRTRTLPLRSPKRGPSFFPTLQGITFEVENLERLRCWVLGLAIGNFLLVGLALHVACSSISFQSTSTSNRVLP